MLTVFVKYVIIIHVAEADLNKNKPKRFKINKGGIMSDKQVYWRHRSGDRLSDFYFDDPTRLLSHNDRFYEDFYIGRRTPSPMLLRTVGLRYCDPEYHFKHLGFGGRYAMLFVFDGEGYVDGIPLTRGNIAYFSRHRLANFSTNPQKLCVYGWFTFADGNSDEIIRKMGLSNKNRIYSTKNVDKIEKIFEEMLYVKHTNADTEIYMDSCLLHLLSLSQYVKPQNSYVENVSENKHLGTALKYISDNFKKADFRISHISEAIGISENHLRAIFRQEMGMSIRDYVIKERINIAVTLLKNSNYNINEIAQFCGYNDYKQFSEQFKKIMGVPPSRYGTK